MFDKPEGTQIEEEVTVGARHWPQDCQTMPLVAMVFHSASENHEGPAIYLELADPNDLVSACQY